MSSPKASSDQTSRIIGPLLHWLFPSISFETEKLVHKAVRKTAHVVEYGVLALFALRALVLSGYDFGGLLTYALALAVVLCIALVDEFNQSFDPTRSSAATDVMLDVAGGGLALLAGWLFLRYRSRRSTAR